MNLGFSKELISPKVPCDSIGKEKRATRIHDDLFVRVMIEKENKINIFLFYDLIAIDEYFINILKKKLKKNSIYYDNLTISCIHTHSAKGGTLNTRDKDSILYGTEDIFRKIDEEYMDFVFEKTIRAIDDAQKNIKEYEIYTKEFIAAGIGKNRNSIEKESDERVLIFKFVSKEDKIILFNFSCHPTVLPIENKDISSDLIHGLYKKFENDFSLVLFANGPAGDISTRFTRKKRDYEEIYRLIDIIYSEYEKVDFKKIDSLKEEIKITDFKIKLEIRKPKNKEVILENINRYEEELKDAKKRENNSKEIRYIESLIEGENNELNYLSSYSGKDFIDLDIKIMDFFGKLIITIPGELYYELGKKLVDKYNAYFFTYTNGYLMYICNMEAYDKGYYEASSSFLKNGQGEFLIDSLDEEIRKIRGKIYDN